MNVKVVNFKDGVYLNGQVRQNIGVRDDSRPPLSLSGLAFVDKIVASAGGLLITSLPPHNITDGKPRFFFVPWASVASVEISDPSKDVRLPGSDEDLMGDDEKLERATRPPGKPAKA